VQGYSDDAVLVNEVSQALGAALRQGESVIVVATLEHLDKIAQKLEQEIRDATALASDGRYLALDAAEVLSRFMVNGMPHPERFSDIFGQLIARASLVSGPQRAPVTIFSEMVALLFAHGEADAALRLEELWNQLARTHSFSLYCTYLTQSFATAESRDIFLRICPEHSRIVSTEEGPEMAGDEQGRAPGRRREAEISAEWQKHEQRFRHFVEAVQDYAIFMLDSQGNISSWNKGAERIKGYKASEIMGKNFAVFYPEEDVRSGKPPMELEVAAREGRFEDEGWRVRKDGSRFWANVIITALRDESNNLVGFGKVTRDITDRMQAQQALDRANQELRKEVLDRKLAQQKLAESEKSLRALSLHLLRTQDEERRRIGRDLHDSLGQILTVIKMNLQSLLAKTGNPDPDLARCIQLADDCIKEVRTVSYLLYPPMLEELGLKSAVSWYLDGFSARSGIRTTFEASSEFGRLPREMELALFRVLQEGLTNVHRHSGSRVAHVRLAADGAMAILEIRDTGRGIAPFALERLGEDWMGLPGVGLRSMKERIQELGGRLELSSSEKGTTLTAKLPAAGQSS